MANEFKVKKGLIVDGSGGTILDVQGSVGQLFSVTDSLTGDLFAVSDISGIPILNVNSSGAVDIDGTLTVDGAVALSPSGGNVGIGTTEPGSKLHVQGGNIQVNSDAYGNTGLMRFFGTDNAEKMQLGSLSSGGFIYTPANLYLAIYTGASEHMRITSDGNVGIKTTSPNTFLHIAGQGNRAGGQIYLGNQDNGSVKYGLITSAHYNAATESKGFTLITGLSTATENTVSIGGFIYESNPATAIRFFTHTATTHTTGGSERMRITSDGNVGIGTTNPGYKLDVAGYIRANDRFYATNGTNTVEIGSTYIQTYLNSGAAAAPLLFYTGITEKVRIASDGNVGIGTTSPASKLTVGGSATGFSTAMQVWQDGQTALSGDVGGKAATFFGTSGLSNSSIVNIYSTGAHTGQTGGEIGFGGKYASGGNVAQFAKIISFKTNNSDGGVNYGGGLEFWTRPNGSSAVARMTILGDGNVGINNTSPKTKLDVNGEIGFGSKSMSMTGTFAAALTVNMNNHTGCYVKITAFGDWSSHSTIAYLGEFFLQNGAGGYAEPGVIIRQVDNTPTDDVQAQIVDPAGSGTRDFIIQLKTTSASGTPFTAVLQYEVRGQYNSVY